MMSSVLADILCLNSFSCLFAFPSNYLINHDDAFSMYEKKDGAVYLAAGYLRS